MSIVYFIYKTQKYPIELELFNNHSLYFQDIEISKAKKEYNFTITDEFEVDHMIPEKVVKEFIQYFYDEEINFDYNNIFSIKYLSRKYQIPKLTEKIDTYIHSNCKSIANQFFSINKDETLNRFDFYEIEEFFSDHISELINDNRLHSFSVSILYRILSNYTNQKNKKEIQNKKKSKSKIKSKQKNKKMINQTPEIKDEALIDFIVMCIKEKGIEASILFTTINIENRQLDYLFNKLNLECESINVDFNVLQKQIIRHISIKNQQIHKMKQNFVNEIIEMKNKNNAEIEKCVNLIKSIEEKNEQRIVQLMQQHEEHIKKIESNLNEKIISNTNKFDLLINDQITSLKEMKEEQKDSLNKININQEKVFYEMKNEFDAEKNELKNDNIIFLSKAASKIKKLKEIVNKSESTNFILFNKMINNKNVQIKNIFNTLSYIANQFNKYSQPINIFESFFIPNGFDDLKNTILYFDESLNRIQDIGIKSETIEMLFSNEYFSLSEFIEYLVNKFNHITFEVCSSAKSFYDILNSISEIKNKSNQLKNILQISIVFGEEGIRDIKKYKELVNSISINDPVKTIKAKNFEGFTSLYDVEISDSVTSLNSGCFSGCKLLESIEIPDTVKSIKDSCFLNCSSLETVIIPYSVTKICDNAFEGCSSLACIYHSNQLKNIKNICITQVEVIGKSAFKGCTSIDSILISKSLKLLDSYCFYGCSSLVEISIPSSITEIRDHVFENCFSLEDIEIPDSIESFGDSCFSNCSKLERISIPSSVKSIGSCAFYNCSSLKYIFIPSSVDEIGENAFAGCKSLDFIATSKSLDSFKFDIEQNTIIFECENESSSLLLFGNMLNKGEYVPVNKMKAIEYFSLAEKRKYDAEQKLKQLLFKKEKKSINTSYLLKEKLTTNQMESNNQSAKIQSPIKEKSMINQIESNNRSKKIQSPIKEKPMINQREVNNQSTKIQSPIKEKSMAYQREVNNQSKKIQSPIKEKPMINQREANNQSKGSQSPIKGKPTTNKASNK